MERYLAGPYPPLTPLARGTEPRCSSSVEPFDDTTPCPAKAVTLFAIPGVRGYESPLAYCRYHHMIARRIAAKYYPASTVVEEPL